MRSLPQGKSSPHGRITSVNGLASVRLSATAPQGKASHRDANTSRNNLGTCGISSQHRARSKLVTLKAIPASSELGNSLSFRGCTPIYQRLPKSVLADDNRTCREVNRSAKSTASIGMPQRDDVRAFFDAMRTEFFENYFSRGLKNQTLK